MDKARRIFVEHWAVILLAVIVSLITAFPQIYFRIEHRSDGIYQGIELLPDSPWSARVREIQDGHGFGSIYYKEGKGDPYLHTPLGSIVVAYMGEALGFDINNTILFSRLFLSLLAFLLIYSFVFLISKDKAASLASASVILLADALVDYSSLTRVLSDALQGVAPSIFLEISRPVYSLMIFVPFFAFLISFWLFYNHKHWLWGVVSAILLGSGFYNYFYLWSYLYAFMSILILLLLMRKHWREALKIVSVFMGGILLGLPYAYNLYRASLYPIYEELGLRHGIVLSHSPLFIGSMALLALIIFIIGFSKEDKEKYFFSLALLLAPVLTMNQQILTGQVLQTGHYHWYFHKPVAIIFVFIIIFYWLTKLNWHATKRVLAIIIILVSFATGIFVQAASYLDDDVRDGGAIAIERQKYGEPMRWFSENAPLDDVVLANNEASQMVVIYTPLNVFYHRSAQLFLAATEERLLDVTFTFMRLKGVGERDAQDAFRENLTQISADVYGIYYRESHGSYGAIPDEKFEEIVGHYKDTLKTPTSRWLHDIMNKYEVNYILWDKMKDPKWDLGQYQFLKKVADFGTMAIYQVEK